MNFPDFLFSIYWWSIFFIIGVVFLPLTSLIFTNFFDKGYAFSKILGMLFLSYIVWILGSLHIIPFNISPITGIILIFVLINLFLLKHKKLLNTFKLNLKIFILEEILFAAGLFFWVFIRAHEPSIHGLEKYMDFGFINSILRSDYFPPKDLWLTPETINYYYFGHLIAAVLTKLSNLDSTTTYNLILATLFGLTLTASFSIGGNLYNFFAKKNVGTILAGLISAFLTTLAGNLHTIYIFFKSYTPPENPIPFWQLQPMLNFSGYWYPNATRFIPNTIHEFPIYSFVVADLHGHVLNIPVVLLIIAILISIFFQKKIHLLICLLLGLTIAITLMTNVLDGPIYLLLIVLIIFCRKLAYKYHYPLKELLLIFISAVIFSLPFWLNFKPFGQGIGVLCAPQFLLDIGKLGPFLFETDHCQRSPIWMLAIIYGFFYILTAVFILKIIKPKPQKADLLAIIFIFFATVAIIIPEFFYVKDIYPGHFRANTVFKFGYQAFIILSLINGYMIARMITNTKKLSFAPVLIICFLFSLVAIYPYFAINSYYNGLKSYKGLDGLVYLKDLYPEDYQAILYIRKNIEGQPVILEAQGESYTDYARVSSNTGLPTIMGWPVHEWLWRGSPDEGSIRSEDIRLLYENQDIIQTISLIKKYNISYIFIGRLEREKYQNLYENKFFNLGKVIFREGGSVIYRLN